MTRHDQLELVSVRYALRARKEFRLFPFLALAAVALTTLFVARSLSNLDRTVVRTRQTLGDLHPAIVRLAFASSLVLGLSFAAYSVLMTDHKSTVNSTYFETGVGQTETVRVKVPDGYALVVEGWAIQFDDISLSNGAVVTYESSETVDLKIHDGALRIVPSSQKDETACAVIASIRARNNALTYAPRGLTCI